MTFPIARLWLAGLALVPLAARAQAPAAFPDDHRTLTKTISYDEMEAFLKSVDGKGPITVSVEGTTTKGRSVYLVHATRGGQPAFRILFYAQQHGDEVSGKDALLYLIRDIAAKPELLPAGRGPLDHADDEPGRRRGRHAPQRRRRRPQPRPHRARAAGDAGAPPGRAPRAAAPGRGLPRVHPRLRGAPRSAGGSRGPTSRWTGVNNPLFDPAVIAAAQRWVDESAAAEAAAGHPFLRYSVGGLPPDEEQRHSAPDIDGGLNAVGAYGGLSFIIEAAVMRAAPDAGGRPRAAGSTRTSSCSGGSSTATATARRTSRRSSGPAHRPLPAFIPTNYLWVNPGMTITRVPGRRGRDRAHARDPDREHDDRDGGQDGGADAARLRGRAAAPPRTSRALLERHGIPYEELTAPRTVRAEACTLLRIEDEFDDVYSRYEGRQIVRREAAAPTRAARRDAVGAARGRGRRAGRARARAGRDVRASTSTRASGRSWRRDGRCRCCASSR